VQDPATLVVSATIGPRDNIFPLTSARQRAYGQRTGAKKEGKMWEQVFRGTVLAILVPLLVWAADPTNAPNDSTLPTALGIPLGATRDHVEAMFAEAQIPQLRRDADTTVYKEPLAKINNAGMALLVFYEDKLAKIVMLIDIESQNIDPYVSRYQELKTGLTEKYGKPTNHREYMDNTYSGSPLLGLKTGKGEYVSFWKTPDLDIALLLRGDNFNISFALHYEYRTLFEQFQKQQKKKEKDLL
jgi:hypothetical protein